MPTYVYKCLAEDCGRIFEIEQPIKDPPLEHCISCNREVQKIPQNISILSSAVNETPYAINYEKRIKEKIDWQKEELKKISEEYDGRIFDPRGEDNN